MGRNSTLTDMTLLPGVDPNVAGLAAGSSSPAQEVKAKKKPMKSLYLKFFETAPDGKSRICRLCRKSYCMTTATGMCRSSLPPCTLEDNMLIDSCKYLSSSVRLWPKEKVQEITLEVFRSMKEDVKASLQCVSSRFSVTLDFWTSYEKIVYMSVKCHWIDENWVSQKVLLDVCRIPYPCTGPEILQVLMDVLVTYNIDSRVLACTHNNSQDSINACHELGRKLESRKLPFCYIPCAARTLKVIIEAGLENVKPILAKIREFILLTNSNQEMMGDFKHWTEVYQEGSWKLPFYHSANWSSDYSMLDVVKKAPNAMDNTIKKVEEIFGPRDWVLSTSEKSVIDSLHSYLEPFFKTTTNLCNCKLPTVGLVFFFMDHVFELINMCHESSHQEWLKNIAGDMSKTAHKFISEAYSIYTFTAAILDPRIKGELIPETLNSASHLEDARNHFVRDYSNTFQAVGNGHATQDTTEEAGAFSFAEEIIRKRRRVSMTTAVDELSQYLAEPPAPISTDALEWWRGHSSRYPRLSLMARDFLAIQGTSLDPEELFTSKGDSIHKQQYCLPLNSMQATMCIKSWMQSGYHFNFQSTIIDFGSLVESATTTGDIDDSSLLHNRMVSN
ncbi:putative AC9 transposase [Dichanthelium oligosanthes]|uniref:Putative AC9 transposase n=1 Tax=Dichanthelium oligosanthes TaxID=888268 RepID=A0A1E5W997_9POAL|nr:putative AC9 transposase [Dichanthelium oligosanthes]